MTVSIWLGPMLGAYALLFGAAAVGYFLWQVKRKGGRAPVAFKLLRGPGESLRRRMAKFDEDLPQNLLLCSFGPPFAGLTVTFIVSKLFPTTPWLVWTGLGLGVIIAVGGTWFTFRVAMRHLKRFRDDKLGYLGEREVAEHLRPLWAQGYQIFHDVPAQGATKAFNLDHVAVGPAGVVVIEVKTRRKGNTRPGFKEHVVVFDGLKCIWPWGEDRHGPEQALKEAEWLKRFLFERLGLDTPVRAVLALPGWWVEEKVRGPVAVVNSKNVGYAVEGRGPQILSDKEIDLIARLLDTLCRDVED